MVNRMVNSTFLFEKGFVRWTHDLDGNFGPSLVTKCFKNDSKQEVSLIKGVLIIIYSFLT